MFLQRKKRGLCCLLIELLVGWGKQPPHLFCSSSLARGDDDGEEKSRGKSTCTFSIVHCPKYEASGAARGELHRERKDGVGDDDSNDEMTIKDES